VIIGFTRHRAPKIFALSCPIITSSELFRPICIRVFLNRLKIINIIFGLASALRTVGSEDFKTSAFPFQYFRHPAGHLSTQLRNERLTGLPASRASGDDGSRHGKRYSHGPGKEPGVQDDRQFHRPA
jgi:hypothetical protein